MTPPGDSFQDLSLERSAFPVDHGGLTHTDALFCYFVTAHYVRKEERVQPVNLCHWHTGCGAVLSQMCCQHCRANSHVRVPMPLITSHLWLIQTSPHHCGSPPDYTQSRYGWIVWILPARVPKWQLMPKFQLAASSGSISQDPCETKTLTPQGMQMLCQKVMAKSQKCTMLTSTSPWGVDLRTIPGSEGYLTQASLRWHRNMAEMSRLTGA